MKQGFLYKTSLDILFIVLSAGGIGLFINIPFGISLIKMEQSFAQDWEILSWAYLLIKVVSWLLFLFGVYQLKKGARPLLNNHFFSEKVYKKLTRAGIFFIWSSVINFVGVALYLFQVYARQSYTYTQEENLLFPLFTLTIGIFFRIQSNALKMASGLKSENDLTI